MSDYIAGKRQSRRFGWQQAVLSVLEAAAPFASATFVTFIMLSA